MRCLQSAGELLLRRPLREGRAQALLARRQLSRRGAPPAPPARAAATRPERGASAGPGPSSARRPPRPAAPAPPAPPPAPEAAAPLSNRALFRAIPINNKTLEHIESAQLCVTASTAGRLVQKMRRQGDARKLTQRYPLYGDMPPEVERVLGDEHSRRIKFLAAAQAASSLPLPSLPEIAMAGRSNVGKSSLINALTLSSVARQSDKPGVTQSLNFYDINAQMRVVDMPGYGFAFAEAEKAQRWNELMDDYLNGRGSVLKRVLVVLDARHGIKVNDREMLRFLSAANVKFQVVLNKTDMVRPADLARRMQLAAEELGALKGANAHVHAVSTSTGAGIAALARELVRLTSAAGATAAASALPRRDALVAQGLQAPDAPRRRTPPQAPGMREAVAPPVRERP